MSFIKKLIGSNEIILKKYRGENLKVSTEQQESVLANDDYMNICFLDLETTGKNKKDDNLQQSSNILGNNLLLKILVLDSQVQMETIFRFQKKDYY